MAEVAAAWVEESAAAWGVAQASAPREAWAQPAAATNNKRIMKLVVVDTNFEKG